MTTPDISEMPVHSAVIALWLAPLDDKNATTTTPTLFHLSSGLARVTIAGACSIKERPLASSGQS